MDEKQQKIKPQNYATKGICSKNEKMNIKCQLIIKVIAFLSLTTIIFIFFIYYKKQIVKDLLKQYVRKLEDGDYAENLINDDDSNIHTDTTDYITQDVKYDSSQGTAYDISQDTNDTIQDTLYDTSQDTIYDIVQDSYLTDFETEYNITNNIFNNCTGPIFFSNPCDPNITNKEEETEFINDILEQIKENKFKDLFNKTIEEDTNFIHEYNNITYQISTVSSQYSTNLSTVSLEKCESTLKDIYSIDKDEKLILLKLEHKVENIKIPIIEYQLFTKDGLKLNLSCCDHIPELVSIPVNIDVNEEFIHDPNSDFYLDRCYTYTSEYDTDLTLFDRKKNFNEKFLSLCEKNCIYKGYNNTNKRANCECKTKNEFANYTMQQLDVKELLYQFIDFKKVFINIFVITCPKVLFTSKGFKTNFGSYLNIVIISYSIFLVILFIFKGYISFQEKIKKIIKTKLSKVVENDNTQNTHINIKTTELNNQNPNNSDSNIIRKQEKDYNDYNDCEYNNLKYNKAIELVKDEKLTFFQCFSSQIKTNYIIVFTFFINDDYNSKIIKICLFLFWLSLDFAMNALFFTDSTMHKIYKDKGKYTFFYQLPKTIYPILISNFFTRLLKFCSIYEEEIAEIVNDPKKTPETKKEDINEIISRKICFAIFFVFLIILLLFFWYFTSSFCAVFKNTQIPLIKDTVSSYINSIIITFISTLIICSLSFCALKRENRCLYQASDILGKICDFIF